MATSNPASTTLPHRLNGYNLLANSMAQYPDLAIFRRYMAAHYFDLLLTQAEIQFLLNELGERKVFDIKQNNQTSGQFDISFLRLVESRTTAGEDLQWRLLMDLRQKMKDYAELLLRVQSFQNLPSINAEDFKLFETWLADDEGGRSFLQEEERDVWHREAKYDLTSLNGHGQNQDALSRFLEGKLLIWLNNMGLYKLRNQHVTITDPYMGDLARGKFETKTHLNVYSDKTIRNIVAVLSTTLSSLLPVTSIFVLYYVNNQLVRLGLILVFTVITSAIVMSVTDAKRSESFAVAAAYAAVQVVFVSTNGPVAQSCPA